MEKQQTKVLLIEDDEEDYFLIRDMLFGVKGRYYQLDWVNNYNDALIIMSHNQHEAYLVDYQLGGRQNGLDLIKNAIANGCKGPIIMLTGREAHEIDIAAMDAGATDYLVKGQLTPRSLERTLRYAIRHKQTEEALRQSESHFRSIFENATVGILQMTPKGKLINVNQALASMLGYASPQEVLSDNPHGYKVISENKKSFAKLLRSIQVDPTAARFEHTLTHRSGGELHIYISVWVVRDKNGKINYLEGLIEDITERTLRVREQEAILRVAKAMRTAQTRLETVSAILDQLLNLLAARAAMLVVFDSQARSAVVEMARGDWAATTGSHLPGDTGPCAEVIHTAQAYLSNDSGGSLLFPDSDQAANIPAIAGIPLIVREQAIGVLWIGREAKINHNDLRLLTAIAEITANALYRITLHEQTERRLKQLQVLRVIDLAITNNLDLKHVFDTLIQQVTTQLEIDAADFLLVNPKRRTLDFVVGRGFARTVLHSSPLSLDQPSVKRLIENQEILTFTDLAKTELSGEEVAFLASRLSNLLSKPAVYYGLPLITRERVKGVLEMFQRSAFIEDPDWHSFLQTLAGQAAKAIDNAMLFTNMQKAHRELAQAYDSTLEGWARALEFRDYETRGHCQRVTEMTRKLCHKLGISGDQVTHALRGALLHDIGKIGIPDHILLKPATLSEGEWEVMRKHPLYAREMIKPIEFLKPALDIPYYHHEKWDGSGYPAGLAGDAIPLPARLFAIIDVWDALRSDRPYRKAWSDTETLNYIKSQSGSHFDPQVVEAFFEVLDYETRSNAQAN